MVYSQFYDPSKIVMHLPLKNYFRCFEQVNRKNLGTAISFFFICGRHCNLEAMSWVILLNPLKLFYSYVPQNMHVKKNLRNLFSYQRYLFSHIYLKHSTEWSFPGYCSQFYLNSKVVMVASGESAQPSCRKSIWPATVKGALAKHLPVWLGQGSTSCSYEGKILAHSGHISVPSTIGGFPVRFPRLLLPLLDFFLSKNLNPIG